MTAWRTPRYFPSGLKGEAARLRDAIERAQGELSRTANTERMIAIRTKIAKLRKRLSECRQ
jgi:hypothetical protein